MDSRVLHLDVKCYWLTKTCNFSAHSYVVVSYVDKGNYVHAVHYYTFNTMLITLLVIHVYWWMLICRMISKQFQLRGKIPNDVRSGVHNFLFDLDFTDLSFLARQTVWRIYVIVFEAYKLWSY